VIDRTVDAGASSHSAAEMAQLAKAHAYALGFDLAGIAALGPAETADAFDDWIGAGRAGEMHYLARGAEKRRDSRRPVPGTTHAIVVALDYGGREPSGPVARYARGDDYHDVMEGRLRELHVRLERDAGRAIAGKAYVDTGPLLERDLARRAGLGWFGKNTNLLNPTLGSFFFLGCLVLDLEMLVDAPFEADRAGMVRQEHQPAESHAGVVLLSRLPGAGFGDAGGCAVRGGPVRDVYAVHRRVSDGCDRCAARAGCHAVHFVPHDRAQGRNTGRAARADGGVVVWV